MNSRISSLECFNLNGFEQLCKNYAAEKIRGKFLEDEVYWGGAGAIKSRKSLARNMREAAAQVASSRQVLAMFEGERTESEIARAWRFP